MICSMSDTGCPITHGIVKTRWGGQLNDNIESWKVSHFEAKHHTFQTRGVRF
jgi:hypothetical protein